MDQNEKQIEIDITERVAQAPDEILSIITGGLLETFITDTSDIHTLSDEQTLLMENEMVLALLAFSNIDDLPTLLQSEADLTPEQAETINTRFCTDVLESIKHLYTDNVPLNNLSKVHSAEEPAVQPLRTLVSDTEKVHGYGAYRGVPETEHTDTEPVHQTAQTDVLSTKPKLADTPTYTPSQPQE